MWASQRITTPPSVWAPTVCGLAAIPLIVDPIDHGVDVFMERVYRPLLRPESNANEGRVTVFFG